MFKSIFRSAIFNDSNLINIENKCVHAFRTRVLLISKHNKSINCVPQHVRPIGLLSFTLRSYSSNHPNNLSHQLNSRSNDQIEETRTVGLYDNQEVMEEKSQKDDSDLFDSIDFNEITGNDEELLNTFKLLLLEVDVMRQDGERVPKIMSTDQWKELLSLKTRSQRLKLLKFLWLNEIKKLSDKRKRAEKKSATLERLALKEIENGPNNHITYGFNGSTIFIRVYDTTINCTDNNRLVQAMRFGQNVVVDCGYDNHMSPMENKLCAKQLGILFAENRMDREPFNIHFCNMNRSSIQYKALKKFIPTLEDPEFPLNLIEEHYLDLFPKDKLVYLTPHCRTELQKFDHDDVYIIGALVDKRNSEPLSLAKAKREGIRMAQLPLDRYLDWGAGTKSLTINQVLKILLDIRTTGDWNIALKNVPRRKVRRPDDPIQDLRKLYRRGTTIQPPGLVKNHERFY